jgi:hypothetical protein
MLFIKRGTIPTREEFDKAWDTQTPDKHYLEFDDSRVGACSLPRNQIYQELKYAHLDWSNCTSESLEAYNWMCHILEILKISWE